MFFQVLIPNEIKLNKIVSADFAGFARAVFVSVDSASVTSMRLVCAPRRLCRPYPGLFQSVAVFPAFPRWATVCRPYGTLRGREPNMAGPVSGERRGDCSKKMILFGPAAWEGYFFA